MGGLAGAQYGLVVRVRTKIPLYGGVVRRTGVVPVDLLVTPQTFVEVFSGKEIGAAIDSADHPAPVGAPLHGGELFASLSIKWSGATKILERSGGPSRLLAQTARSGSVSAARLKVRRTDQIHLKQALFHTLPNRCSLRIPASPCNLKDPACISERLVYKVLFVNQGRSHIPSCSAELIYQRKGD